MPKFPSLKLLRDSIASRTRLGLGIPITKAEPVQYPSVWPLFRSFMGGNSNPGLATSSRLRKPISRWTSPTSKSKEKSVEKDCDSLDNQAKTARRRNVRTKGDNYFLRQMEPSKQTRQQLANANRRIQRSLIQLVRFKPSRHMRCAGTGNSKRGRHIQGRSRRTRSRRKTSTLHRRRRRRHAAGSRKDRRRRQQRNRHNRRRVRYGRIRRRRSRLGQRKKIRRRRRRHARSDQSNERKRVINPGPSFSHERDCMLNEQGQIITGNLDEGHDEVKDDPLNDVCRSLVKSLHGTPADCRGSNTNQKNSRPEMEKEKRKREKKRKGPKKRSCKRSRNNNSSKNKSSSKSHSGSRRYRQRRGSRRVHRPIIRRRRRVEIKPIAEGNRRLNKMVKRARRQPAHNHHHIAGYKAHPRHHHSHHHPHCKAHCKHHCHHHHHHHHHHHTSRGNPRHGDTAKQRRRKPADKSHRSKHGAEGPRRGGGNKNNNRVKQVPPMVWRRVNGRLKRVHPLVCDRLRRCWNLSPPPETCGQNRTRSSSFL